MDAIKNYIDGIKEGILSSKESPRSQQEACHRVMGYLDRNRKSIDKAFVKAEESPDEMAALIKHIMKAQRLYTRLDRLVERARDDLGQATQLHVKVIVKMQDVQLRMRRVIICAIKQLAKLQSVELDEDDSDLEDFFDNFDRKLNVNKK